MKDTAHYYGHAPKIAPTTLCRWGPRANPSATIQRDQVGDYWVSTPQGGEYQTRQFDTLRLAYDYADAMA